MVDPTVDATLNATSRRRKMLIISNVLVGLFTGAYTVSPIDLLPDVLPFIGWTDDLLGIAMAIAFTIYTVRTVRQKGFHGLAPSLTALGGPDARALTTTHRTEDTPTIVDVKVEGTEHIPGYDPIPADKLKSL